jgi:hypothetical protein
MKKVENTVFLGLDLLSCALKILNQFALLANHHQQDDDTSGQ